MHVYYQCIIDRSNRTHIHMYEINIKIDIAYAYQVS